MNVDQASAKNIDEIVELQLVAQSSFFAARLGRDFLLKQYWPIIFSMPAICDVLIARDRGQLSGLVVYTSDVTALKNALSKRKWHALPSILKLGLRSPRDILEIFQLSRSKAEQLPESAHDKGQVELFTIAVAPEMARQNVGTRLISAGKAKYPGQQIIVWAEEANVAAVEFYRKNGFALSQRQFLGRLKLCLFVMNAPK